MSGLFVAAITIIFFKPCMVVGSLKLIVTAHVTIYALEVHHCIYLHSVQLGL